MKPLKKSILLSLVAPLLFSLLSFKAFGSSEGKELVIIRIQEAQAGGMGPGSHILVSEKGQIKVINLEKFGNVSSNTKNLETISTLLSQYLKDGYDIKNSSSLTGAAMGITTYILTK